MVIFFDRFAESIDKNDSSLWRPGDVIFFVLEGRRHPYHVGIIADSERLYHLYPPHAALDRIEGFGPIHSVFRWSE